MSTALDRYTNEAPGVQLKAERAGEEGKALALQLVNTRITNNEQYAVCAGILKEVKAQIKFIDEERKISTGPLNDEVKRVNAWYSPALKSREKVVEHLTTLMQAFVMQQRREEARLLEEAAEVARAALAASKPPEAAQTASDASDASDATVTAAQTSARAATLVTQAAAAPAPKLKGVSTPDTFEFTVVDASLVPREFLMVDMKALAAHVKANGLKHVPAGVEVKANVRITTRG